MNNTLKHTATTSSAVTVVASTLQQPKKRSLLSEFLLGGSATMTACLFTNPLEVIKTRMQVQGELQSQNTPKVYRNLFQGFVLVAKNEGAKGLQGGLGPALLYQLMMNGTRLGLYEPIKDTLTKLSNNTSSSSPNVLLNVLSGSTSGVIAAVMGSPFFMIKVRLQVASQQKSSVAALTPTVGVQHNYKGALSGLWQVFQQEGAKGLYRGASAAMVRVGIGSGVQLSTYDSCKHFVISTGVVHDGVAVHFLASLISGFFVTLAMNPADVLSTRLYNQKVDASGRGVMYSSYFDCLKKTYQFEGMKAFFKGLTSHYFRLGPHTILTFIFWEQYKKLANQLST